MFMGIRNKFSCPPLRVHPSEHIASPGVKASKQVKSMTHEISCFAVRSMQATDPCETLALAPLLPWWLLVH